MYVPEKLKLNKFVKVNIPSPAQMFGRYGVTIQERPQNFTGEESASTPGNKMDILSKEMEMYHQFERENAKTDE